MLKFEYRDNFIYRPWDGYLRIDSDKTKIILNQVNIIRAKDTLLKFKIDKLSFGTPFENLADLSFLSYFHFLKGLEIGLNNFYISPVFGLKEIEELSISFHFKGVINFSNFSLLKKVHINWENEGVESLLKCEQLKDVSIMNYSGLTLTDLGSWKELKNLSLYDPTCISLTGIGNLEKIENIRISGAKKLKDLGDIENIQNLQHFTLHGAKNLEDLTPIMYLRNLKMLNLDTLGSIPTIRFVETLKNLEEFYMTETTNVEDGDLSVLDHLRKYHKLKKVGFANRKHYSHTREQLGYQVPPEVAAIFAKKKK